MTGTKNKSNGFTLKDMLTEEEVKNLMYLKKPIRPKKKK